MIFMQAYRDEHLELQEAQNELAAARAESSSLAEAQQRCTSLSQVLLWFHFEAYGVCCNIANRFSK